MTNSIESKKLQLEKLNIRKNVLAEQAKEYNTVCNHYNALLIEIFETELQLASNKFEYLFNAYYQYAHNGYFMRDRITGNLGSLLSPYNIMVHSGGERPLTLTVQISFEVWDTEYNNKQKEGLKLVLPYIRPYPVIDFTNSDSKTFIKTQTAKFGLKIIKIMTPYTYGDHAEKYDFGIKEDGSCYFFNRMSDTPIKFENMETAFDYIYSNYFEEPYIATRESNDDDQC